MTKPSDTCSHWVTRSTGLPSTPLTQTRERVQCGRPTVWEAVATFDGQVYGWACARHRSDLDGLAEVQGIELQQRTSA